MIIQPKIRGFFCLTSHPTGCATHVRQQIDYVKLKGPIANGPKRVLVVGASTGYGLASRITAAFGSGAGTVGVFFDKAPTERKPGTAGWYNTAAFTKAAREAGLYAKSINGDGFSDDVKAQAIDAIRKDLGTIDLFVYSLAAPRRTHPRTGEVFQSTLKPLGRTYTGKTVDTDKLEVKDVTIEPATEDDVRQTVAVMGGEDWEMWIDALLEAGVLAEGCRTVAYTYIGTELTWAIYREGTIGKAKEDLERAAAAITERLRALDGRAYIAVMKALVTQSSSAIPVVPLYISTLYKVMKEKGIHEGCVEQIHRMFVSRLYAQGDLPTDDAGRLRLDDREMRDDVQSEVAARWTRVSTENLAELTDIQGYRSDFLRLFGFGLDGVDYEADVNPLVEIE